MLNKTKIRKINQILKTQNTTQGELEIVIRICSRIRIVGIAKIMVVKLISREVYYRIFQ